MYRWGITITTIYVLIVFLLLVPGANYLWTDDYEYPETWLIWVWWLPLVFAQPALLFVSVDVSRKRPPRRKHILFSVAAITIAAGLLSCAAIWSLGTVIFVVLPEESVVWPEWIWMPLAPATFWIAWGVILFLYRHRLSERLDSAINWLLAGSVLELLVAVPCHIVLRHRDECTAPVVTAYGIATGIAIMLLAIGPAVLFLYQKRLDRYRKTA